jgi:hypothetical protein
MVEITQMDIFGNGHKLSAEEKPKKVGPIPSSAKGYVDITLKDGLLESSAANDAILIHRILQRKLIYGGLTVTNQQSAYLRIFENEMRIKRGKELPSTASRDSLLAFFTMRYT